MSCIDIFKRNNLHQWHSSNARYLRLRHFEFLHHDYKNFIHIKSDSINIVNQFCYLKTLSVLIE